MSLKLKASLVLIFLALMLLSSVITTGPRLGTNPDLHKEEVGANSRKLLGFDSVLDYDYTGPNPKHDPRGKRGGGGSKNP